MRACALTWTGGCSFFHLLAVAAVDTHREPVTVLLLAVMLMLVSDE